MIEEEIIQEQNISKNLSQEEINIEIASFKFKNTHRLFNQKRSTIIK